jgi:hypothetical protein
MADNPIGKKEIFEYAWEWFRYHAGQRLEAFRFFTVFLGLLAVAFAACLKEGYLRFIGGIAVFIAFISFAFLVLEIRNEQLVEIGKDALLQIEEMDEFQAFPKECRLHTMGCEKRNRLLSHGIWFKVIYGVCIGISLVLAWYFTIGPLPVPGKGL